MSLSEPHINGLSGAGCYGVSYNCTSVCHTSIWPPECRGPNLFAPVHIMCTVWLRMKMAASRKRFAFSLQSASDDHYIKRNNSSSPILPTINDVCCKIRNTSDYVQLYGLCAAVLGHTSKGLAAIGCQLLLRVGIGGIECQV